MTPLPTRSLARLRIAVDYAVMRHDVRSRFTTTAHDACSVSPVSGAGAVNRQRLSLGATAEPFHNAAPMGVARSFE